MELQGTRTQANLLAAFAGEAQAYTKYEYYSKQAKKEGYVHMSQIFTETANNEKVHAKIWFKLLHDGVPDTSTNLIDAAGGEHYEWSDMYAQFEKEAREEGFDRIANLFRMVANIEKDHEKRYNTMKQKLTDEKVFSSDQPVDWICLHCGHVHDGTQPPGVCPVCAHPRAYFTQQQGC